MMTNEPKVGSTLRIRLPNDYLVLSGPALKITRIDAECQAYETLTREARKLDLFFYNGGAIPRRSWWRRRLDAARYFGRRVRDAWRVLTGETQVYDD